MSRQVKFLLARVETRLNEGIAPSEVYTRLAKIEAEIEVLEVKQAFVILVCIDLVDSTKFIESLGDVRASKAMCVYDRIFRGLLFKYNGLEIDKTDGALLIFETMREALAYITEYHALVEHHLCLRSQAGIHCGNVIMHSNNATLH